LTKKNTCTSSGKSKLAMVAIFFRKKTSIRNAHFQFSFMPVGKKMANYATFAFSLPFRYFFSDSDFSMCSFGRVKIEGALDFRIFRWNLAPIATERPEWSGAE